LLHPHVIDNQQIWLEVPLHHFLVALHGFVMKEVTYAVEDRWIVLEFPMKSRQ
jgi:hypothetical protein